MSISNDLIDILMNFTSALNGLPSGVEFEMAALDEDFEQKTEEFRNHNSMDEDRKRADDPGGSQSLSGFPGC